MKRIAPNPTFRMTFGSFRPATEATLGSVIGAFCRNATETTPGPAVGSHSNPATGPGPATAPFRRYAAELLRDGGRALARRGLEAAFALALLTATGCGASQPATSADVDPASWHDAAEVALVNTDTLTERDLMLYLRCNDRFGEDTLTVRIAVCTPDSLRYEEPFTLVIPPTGTPAALAREVAVPYRRRVVFRRTGLHRIRITPLRPVRGVEAAGIHTEKSH